ncbi:MAG TPA: hypothetical protein VHV79_03185 [Mycobacteriales bacterium]|jgi:hypothetical protein|nr:hypothetical protein [Mycobacteriales bacterium]
MRSHRLTTVPMLLIAAAGLVVGLALPAAGREAGHLINGKTIAKHSIAGNRLKNHTVTSSQIKGLVWHRITHFENSWADGSIGSEGSYRSPGYAIDDQGTVHLRGTLSGGKVGFVAFVLPKAASPAGALSLNVPMLVSGGGSAWLAVTSAGVIPSSIGAGDAANVTDLSLLEGITYDPH